MIQRSRGARGPAGDLVRAIASGWSEDDGAQLLTGRAALQAPPGQQYFMVPPHRPRILLPLGQPRVAAGSLLANLPLRRRSDRVRRRALAVAVRALPDLRAPRTWLGAVAVAADSESSLLSALHESWDRRVSGLSFTVRPSTPNHKPTFVALDTRGTVLGYGKIATNPGTIERARCEADGLRWMNAADVPGLRAPEVLAELRWGDCLVVVSSPLPAASRRYPVDDRAPAHLVEHARGTGLTLTTAAVGGRLLDRIAEVADPEIGDAARRCADRLLAAYGDVALPAGRLHGDWVPWNLGVHGREVWAWDWEHSESESAVGLDLVHWHLLVQRDRRRTALAEAIPLAESVATEDLRRHATPRDEVAALLALARLRVVARACVLHQTSGLWVHGERDTVLDLLNVTPQRAQG